MNLRRACKHTTSLKQNSVFNTLNQILGYEKLKLYALEQVGLFITLSYKFLLVLGL